jgi:hypothetical protein
MSRKDDKKINFWVTQEEYESIKADQQSMDYTNLSKYLRSLVLRKKIPIKKVVVTDRAIRKQINDISIKIGRIGANYNQAIKKINSLAGATRKNGDPVLNTKYLTHQLDRLERMSSQVITLQQSLIETVNQLDLPAEDK